MRQQCRSEKDTSGERIAVKSWGQINVTLRECRVYGEMKGRRWNGGFETEQLHSLFSKFAIVWRHRATDSNVTPANGNHPSR